MVLTESSAKKFFGNEDPMGRILIFSNDNLAMKVTGIAEDPPVNSHIRFNYLVSITSSDIGKSEDWLSSNLQTYFILNKGSDINIAGRKVNGLIEKYIGPKYEQSSGITLQQLKETGGAFAYIIDPVKARSPTSASPSRFPNPGIFW